MIPIKKLWRWSLCLCVGTLTSCIADDMDVAINDANLVKLNLQIGSTPVVTKATEPGTTEWNENLVETADVFFFDADNGNLVHYQRIEGQNIQTSGEVALSLRKDEVQNSTYDIYVIANYTRNPLDQCTDCGTAKKPHDDHGLQICLPDRRL